MRNTEKDFAKYLAPIITKIIQYVIGTPMCPPPMEINQF